MGWRDGAEVVATAPAGGWRVGAEVVDTSQSNSGTQDALRMRGRAEGIGRAVASTADAMVGGIVEDTAAVGARVGDAFEKGDGIVDTAARLGKEAVRGWSPAGVLAELATAGPLGGPLRDAIAPILREAGLLGPEDLAPAEKEFRDERQAQLDDDAARDPTGTGIAKAATVAAGIAAMQPTAAAGAARGVASASVGRGLDAAKAAMSGPLAQTVKQTAAGVVDRTPLGPIINVAKTYGTLSDDAAAMIVRTAALKHGTASASTLARLSGLPVAQVERGLAKLAQTPKFKADLAKAAKGNI